MYVTRKADYAIRCVLYLSRNAGRLASVDEISRVVYVPRSFLAKILQRLMKTGIVSSVRGVKGGFQLAKNPQNINLLEVIEAIQGHSAANICAIEKKKCSLSAKCAVHPVWLKIRKKVEQELRKNNFANLAKQ
ncbi:MAG: Rrf2 family transcriptional regulator [Nitrospirae bacterium]|nr:Rrf2 family transcriptional regulator [Nitrospirota bacterium]MBI4839030.1 Rrf2 family transcriptional regulator [Nitrospirota bacterium]